MENESQVGEVYLLGGCTLLVLARHGSLTVFVQEYQGKMIFGVCGKAILGWDKIE